MDEKTYAQQLDLLRFQVQEISAARLQPDEEKSVEAEFHRASNAAKLLQLSQAALDVLSESENSLLTQAGAIGRVLAELQRVDAGAAHLVGLHAQAVGDLARIADRAFTLRGKNGRGSRAASRNWKNDWI